MFRLITAVCLAVTVCLWASIQLHADIAPPYTPFGIGAGLEEGQPFPKLTKIVAGGPASRAGLKAGDGVIGIGGSYSKGGAPLYFFARKLQGPQNSEVEIVVLREEREVIALKLKRTYRLR
jgi:C-terminal processing protease CtpA/Prc